MILLDMIKAIYGIENQWTNQISNTELITFYQGMDIVFQLFMIENEYTAYAPIFVYQYSALLITLTKHNLLKKWCQYYFLLLNYPLLFFMTTDFTFAPMCYTVIWYLHEMRNENKYICWCIIFCYHSLLKQGVQMLTYIPDDFKYYPIGYTILYFLYFFNFYINKISL
jgi:hypothetical protein